MLKPIHYDSEACNKSELNIFSVPPTQVTVEKSKFVDYYPVSTLSEDSAPIEFFVPGNGEDYLDPSRMQLYIKAKIKTADGEDLGAEDQIAPQNLFLQSLFSQVNVSLNDKLVTPSATTYPYRAMIETLLNFGPAAKQSQMTSGLYYKDTPGKMDVVNPLAVDANANMGLKKRRSFIATSRSCDMSGPIHADICFQERLIIPGVDIKVKLVRSPNKFCLLAGGEQPAYKVIIQEAVLRVRRVTVSPTLRIEHEKFLDKTTAKYPISRVEVKSMAIPQGLLSLDRENVFLGVLPKRVVMALVHSEAYHGSYAKNAFNFHHYKVTQVALSVNGETRKPIQVQFDDAGTGLYIRGYETLFSGMDKMFADSGNLISREDYAKGYALYAIDLTPDFTSSEHFNPVQTGNVRLSIQFSEALPHTVTCLVYAEFESLIEIDKSRNIIFDFST